MADEIDDKFMKEALRQARKGLGRTSPNPAVGAVIVREGRAIALGYHRKAGAPHAEVDALNKLGGKAPGSTLYVNLEPCNHHGHTPPCTEALLNAGIKRVVIGMRDPNPGVAGGGCEYLRQRGVLITTGVLEAKCYRLNEAYTKYVTQKRPFVILKSALTLDGWTATSTGHARWITNKRSRQYVHRLRDRADAVMVGVGTIIADDPLLTTRLGRGRGKDPLRIIVDSHLRTPLHAKVLNHGASADTLMVTGPDVAPEIRNRFQRKGVSTIACPTKDGRIDLNALMDTLGKMSITSLMVEGGAGISGAMIRERLIDKFYVFQAPKLLGADDGVPMATGLGPKKMDQCLHLKDIEIRRLGEDILIKGYPDY